MPEILEYPIARLLLFGDVNNPRTAKPKPFLCQYRKSPKTTQHTFGSSKTIVHIKPKLESFTGATPKKGSWRKDGKHR